VAQSLRRASTGWLDRRAASRTAQEDHRRQSRGGDRQDAGDDAEGRDALVDALNGRRGRAQPDRGTPHLEGVRLQPHRSETWRLSKDPQFIEKVRDVVGLYLNPPERAVVLCVDEKTQIQALDRTAPILPMLPGVPQRATHDYKRSGTSSLYAALDLATGQVIGRLHSRHRAIEFKQFLATLDREVPTELDVHVVLDNSSTHKTPAIQKWLAAHPRFALHFTPTSSSSLNLVERWFAELTTKKLRRGAHRSVPDLNADIRDWIQTSNDDPRPYVWTKTADQILESIATYCTRINESCH
jgi:transposase